MLRTLTFVWTGFVIVAILLISRKDKGRFEEARLKIER